MKRVSVITVNNPNKTLKPPDPPDPPQSPNSDEKIIEKESYKNPDVESYETIDTDNPTHEMLVAFQMHHVYAIQNSENDAELERILENMGNRAIKKYHNKFYI